MTNTLRDQFDAADAEIARYLIDRDDDHIGNEVLRTPLTRGQTVYDEVPADDDLQYEIDCLRGALDDLDADYDDEGYDTIGAPERHDRSVAAARCARDLALALRPERIDRLVTEHFEALAPELAAPHDR